MNPGRAAWFFAALLSVAAASCATPEADVILRGRACGPYGACATGFVCDDRVNLCVLPSQLAAGGAGGTSSSDVGSTGGHGASGGAAGDGGELDTESGGAAGMGGGSTTSSDDAGISPLEAGAPAELVNPATGALAQREVYCGASGSCGGGEQCCASTGVTRCRLASAWCACSGCVALMCDGPDDCPAETICCALAEGTRCVAPDECSGSPSCSAGGSCDALLCSMNAVVDGSCRGPVQLLE